MATPNTKPLSAETPRPPRSPPVPASLAGAGEMEHDQEQEQQQQQTGEHREMMPAAAGHNDAIYSTDPEKAASLVTADGHGGNNTDNADSASTAASNAPTYVTGLSMVLIMVAIITASILVLLDMSIISTAIPKITSEFHSLPDIGWYGSAYQLTNAAVQPLVGKTYTYFKMKWTYLIFFFLFELGSLLCGAANSSAMLIVGRAIAGIGCAGVFSGSLTMITTTFDPAKRSMYTGITFGFAQLGIVIGPLIGGALTEKASWRWCFYINLPLGAIVLAGILFVDIRDSSATEPVFQVLSKLHEKFDLIGFALLSPSAVMLLLALQWGGNTAPWDSAKIIGLFCGSGATFLLFVAWSWYKGDDSLIPTSVVKNRIIVAACFMGAGIMVASITPSYWMPVYFQSVLGKSPIISGVDLLPVIIPGLVFSVFTGWLIGKIGYYIPPTAFGAVLCTIATGLLTTLTPRTPQSHWIAFLFLLGLGRGMSQQASVTAITHAAPPKLVPLAMSTMIFSQYIAAAVFTSLSNVIFNSKLRSGIAKHAPDVDAEKVINAGATAVRNINLDPKQLTGVLEAYSEGLSNIFYISVAGSIWLFIATMCSGWVDIREKAKTTKPTVSSDKPAATADV